MHRHWSRSILPLALALAAAAACGDSVSVSNAKPTGSVGGLVIDAATQAPLVGARVRLYAGGDAWEEIQTGADGWFGFERVPAGRLIVTVGGPDGYWGATVHAELVAEAGEFPTGNAALTLGPIGLTPTPRSLRLRVLDERGRSVGGYELAVQTTFEWVDYTSGEQDGQGTRVLRATTDANGYAVFGGLPDYTGLGLQMNSMVYIICPPLDTDAPPDGVLEFPGNVFAIDMRDLGTAAPDIVLDPDYELGLRVVASTIGALENQGVPDPVPTVLTGSEQIFVNFNLPVDSVQVVLSDEWGTPVAIPPTTSVVDAQLTIGMASLPPGAEYNLTIHAIASVGDRVIAGDFAGAFFTRPAADTVTVEASRVCPGNKIRLTFSEPVGGVPGDLANPNCVLFFNYNLDGSAATGDFPGEVGSPDCAAVLEREEPNPSGPAGTSGYTTTWEFYQEAFASGTGWGPLPGGVPIVLVFSRVGNAAYLVERADGRPVPDFTGAAALTSPATCP